MSGRGYIHEKCVWLYVRNYVVWHSENGENLFLLGWIHGAPGGPTCGKETDCTLALHHILGNTHQQSDVMDWV